MKLINLLTLLAMSLAIPTIGHSHHGPSHDRPERPQTKRVTIDREDIRQLNRSGQLGLRRAIKNISSLNRNSKLVSVAVTGRVNGRMNLVTLKIDGSTVDSAYMNVRRQGNHHRSDRDRRRRGKVSKTTLTNRSRNSQGSWRLLVDQDVRVKSVIVTVRNKRSHGGGHGHSQQITLGSFKADKFIGDSKTFYIGHSNVNSITIRSLKNSVNIQNAYVTYSNGYTEKLWNLTGHLAENRSTTSTIRSHRNNKVRSVTVEAISRNVHGSRANVVVYAEVKRR